VLRERINHGIRASAAFALRHSPEFRGRWHVARLVNKHFGPGSQDFCTAWTRMRLGQEMLVDLRSSTEFHTYYLGDYDNEPIRSVLGLIGPGSTVLDVGANIGFWSIPLANHLRGRGCLHAFEPVAANFRRLTENVKRNTLEDTAHLHETGLSDQNGPQQISLREDFADGAETGNATIVVDSYDLLFECTEIRVVRLDDIFDSLEISRIDFIKADIEGHEDKFLAGAADVIRRFRPILYVEINKVHYQRQGRDAATVFEGWLKGNAYSSAVHGKGQWRLDTVRNCSPLDNAFFFPSESAAECLEKLNC
jgi:FkbM family methyltransferase